MLSEGDNMANKRQKKKAMKKRELINPFTAPKTKRQFRRYVKEANKRLSTLEKLENKGHAYEQAQSYLNLNRRKRFKVPKIKKNYVKEYRAIQKFLTSRISTPKGLVSAERRRRETFRKKGIVTNDYNSLYTFLSSDEFRTARKYQASNQILKTADTLLNEGMKVNDILKEFRKFNQGDLTLEEIRNRKKRGVNLK